MVRGTSLPNSGQTSAASRYSASDTRASRDAAMRFETHFRKRIKKEQWWHCPFFKFFQKWLLGVRRLSTGSVTTGDFGWGDEAGESPAFAGEPGLRVGDRSIGVGFGRRRTVLPAVEVGAGRAGIEGGVGELVAEVVGVVAAVEEHVREAVSRLSWALQISCVVAVVEDSTFSAEVTVERVRDSNFQAA